MWVLKGTFLGLWLFGWGTIIFMYFAAFRGLRPGTAMGVSVITAYTSQNPWWWASLVACTILGLALVGSYPGKGPVALWVVLIVTGMIPAGFFGLFIFMVAKLREIAATGR
jgi:hypothetical protein